MSEMMQAFNLGTSLAFSEYVLPLADPGATLETVGGKGVSLARLANAGLPVPGGFHVTTDAYRAFVAANDLQPRILAALQQADAAQPATLEAASRAISGLFVQATMPQDIADAVQTAYADLENKMSAMAGEPQGGSPKQRTQSVAVAVRSSATAEDLPDASFAGQQDTYLNIQGEAAVLDAVRRCWASLWTARAIGYRARVGADRVGADRVGADRVGADRDLPLLAVVVQTLVPADAAGIMFTANPVNGRRDQVVINASWGLGEAVVGGLVTPDALTVDKASGQVLARETAGKQVMTVRVESGTEEQPVPEELRNAPVLDDERAAELVRLGVQIEQLYGMPMDIEWALTPPSTSGRGAGGEGVFAILQARPITAFPTEAPLPEAQATAPIEWKLPNPKGQYMRSSVADLMPNPVSPLFETLAVPTIACVGVKEVMRPLTRSEPMLPDYILTINSYVYINGTYTLREWWWILTRMMLSMPRIMREAIPLWRDDIRPRYAATVACWQDRPLEAMSTAELWAAIQEVNGAAMLHLASLLVATTGASAGAEMLFTNVYNKLIRRTGDPEAAVFLMGYDSTPILAEKSLYDLAEWVRERPELAEHILSTPSADIAARFLDSPPGEESGVREWPDFRARLQAHLNTYGHIIYDLDFAKPLPLDDPAPMLETAKMYLRGEGVNPHERQRAAEEKREQSAEAMRARLKGLRRWAFDKTLKIGQTMAQMRENALADIGLGYPVLRQMLRELGRRFVQAAAIAQPDDIFWLKVDEVQDVIAALPNLPQVQNLREVVAERVAQRKATHESLKGVIPPPMLPPRKRYLGIDMEAFTPATEGSHGDGMLKGIAASAGVVTAPACVLHGPEDFDQMHPGDVLVAATTTPAWTPLFAMAAGVVTDIGGPLSHGSIVAREYGIPAVMGTGVATRRIKSGQVITVDGSAGIVVLIER
jgi:phosphohistidine swiveling domain-containing protein